MEEDREMAYIWLAASKEKINKYFDKQVWLRDFHEGDLVLRKVDDPKKESSKGKMAANWEGSYRVIEGLHNRAYHLESIDGKNLPRDWNSCHFQRSYV